MLGWSRSRASLLCGCGATSPQLMRMGWGRAETSAAVIPSPRNGGHGAVFVQHAGSIRTATAPRSAETAGATNVLQKVSAGRVGRDPGMLCRTCSRRGAPMLHFVRYEPPYFEPHAILTAQHSHALDRTRAIVIGKGPVAPLLLWSAAQLSLALGLLAATGTRSLTR
jgi:hypothetical protein